MIRINIYSENIKLPYKKITKKYLIGITSVICKRLALENVIVTIILTDNDFIQGLNREYRKKDRPTDVISFSNRDNPFPVAEGQQEDLGDIYISIEKAEEQAVEYEVSFPEEMNRLLVHGLLHLVGYDHELGEAEEREMSAKEQEILEFITNI